MLQLRPKRISKSVNVAAGGPVVGVWCLIASGLSVDSVLRARPVLRRWLSPLMRPTVAAPAATVEIDAAVITAVNGLSITTPE